MEFLVWCVRMVVSLIYFLTCFHVCAPDFPSKFKTLLKAGAVSSLFALMFPVELSALHTVGAPELLLTDGYNESFNSLMSQWTTEWCNHAADCLNPQTLGRKPKPTQDVVMVL